MGLFGDIVKGVGAIAAPIVGNFFDNQNAAHAQENAQAFSSDQAAVNREFQERMSNTAHQREVEDLKKAGLNPILSAGGGGSSSPSGNAPSGVQANTPQIKMPEVYAMLQGFTQLDQNQQRIDIDKAKAAADIDKKGTDSELNEMKRELLKKGMPAAEIGEDLGTFYKSAKKFIQQQINTNNPKSMIRGFQDQDPRHIHQKTLP